MEEKIKELECKYEVVESKPKEKVKTSEFKYFTMWLVVLSVYLLLFSYIGYIAFWPMSFNDPKETVQKYYTIINEESDNIDATDNKEHFRNLIDDLVKEAESEADDTQQLASQSFNIVLGAFLAFLSATVTTVFQLNKN